MEDLNPLASSADTSDLREQVASLRKTLFVLLVSLVVISGTLNIFLWRQVHYARADLSGLRQQAGGVLADYQQTTGPKMDDFVNKLRDYSKTHPDFAPIANKYGLNQIPTNAPKK